MKLFDPARSDLNLLSISLLIWGLGESLFLIFQPLYLQELGADPVKIGVILSGGLLVMALASHTDRAVDGRRIDAPHRGMSRRHMHTLGGRRRVTPDGRS